MEFGSSTWLGKRVWRHAPYKHHRRESCTELDQEKETSFKLKPVNLRRPRETVSLTKPIELEVNAVPLDAN